MKARATGAHVLMTKNSAHDFVDDVQQTRRGQTDLTTVI